MISIGRQLKRFRPDVREAVAVLARRHRRLAELSESFPALLVALAWPRAGFDPRPVIDDVIAGAPLAWLAERARVPQWLRRMKPEMLPGPLPPLPDSPFIRHRIVNLFPRHPRHAPDWFAAVSAAQRWAHEGFAVWCASAFAAPSRSRRRGRRRGGPGRLPLLCLWAWYSGRTDTQACALAETPWRPDMPLKTAWTLADRWHSRVTLELNLAGRLVDDLGLTQREMDGYAFVPLVSAAEIAAEATAMENCVCTYADGIVHDRLRLWSLRQDGVRIATLSVWWGERDPLPVIDELQLRANQDAPVALWWIARKWLNGHDLPALAHKPLAWGTAPLDADAWRAMWKPYWLSRGDVPAWLPLSPSRTALNDL